MSRRLISLLLVLALVTSLVAFGSVSASAAGTATITVAGRNYTANVGDLVTYKLTFTYPTANLATYQIELPVNFSRFSGPSQEELDNIFADIDDIGFYRYDTPNARGVVGYVENYVYFTGTDCKQPVVVMELYLKVISAGTTVLAADLRDVSDVQDHDIINNKGTVLDNTFSYTESLTVTSGSVKLSGKVQSFLNSNDTVTVSLYKEGATEPVAQVTGTGLSTTYSFDVESFTEYTLTAEKKNHVKRSYSVSVTNENAAQDMKICPIGDANNNGTVTSADSNAVYKHVLGSKLITDEYMLACADVVGSKPGVTSADSNSIYKHVLGSKKLY